MASGTAFDTRARWGEARYVDGGGAGRDETM